MAYIIFPYNPEEFSQGVDVSNGRVVDTAETVFGADPEKETVFGADPEKETVFGADPEKETGLETDDEYPVGWFLPHSNNTRRCRSIMCGSLTTDIYKRIPPTNTIPIWAYLGLYACTTIFQYRPSVYMLIIKNTVTIAIQIENRMCG